MPRWDAEAAVVGLGAWGAAALWRLAVRGVEVLGFERRTPGHALGSSHGGPHMFRLACAEHADLVPLAVRSRELWTELDEARGDRVFQPCGGLSIGPEAGPVAGGALRAAHAHGLQVRTFTANALRMQYPRHTGLPGHHTGVWDPGAGLVHAERAVKSMVAQAQDAGARLYPDTRVLQAEVVTGGVHLRTPQQLVKVRHLVVAAGSWLPAALSGLPLTTVRAPFTRFRPIEPDGSFDLEVFPAFRRELDDARVLWGSGEEGGYGVRLGLEDLRLTPKPLDAEETDRSVTPDDWQDVARLLPAKVPGLQSLPSRITVGTQNRTPDGLPLLGAFGDDTRILLAAGAGSHGPAHAPGAGDIVADLVRGERPGASVEFLSPDRFS
ncbi:FAD-dependent oxidoreductase [Streptomyces sp. NPDC006458]|uniref:FAD-dependent oxidoreductase n=1 Tax=Streptomyces sp. NPDC006458 TaxID=3154302 RepID=UPI0033ADE643